MGEPAESRIGELPLRYGVSRRVSSDASWTYDGIPREAARDTAVISARQH